MDISQLDIWDLQNHHQSLEVFKSNSLRSVIFHFYIKNNRRPTTIKFFDPS